MEDQEREAKIRELAEAFAERLRRAWPRGAEDITRLEEISGEVGGETLREVTEELVREQAERETVQEAACPHCAGRTRYKGRYEQVVVTAQGRVRVRRATTNARRAARASARWTAPGASVRRTLPPPSRRARRCWARGCRTPAARRWRGNSGWRGTWT